MNRDYVVGFALTSLSAIIWGSSYPVIKILLRELTVFDIAMYRATLASLTMVVISRTLGNPITPRRCDVGKLLLVSALGVWIFWVFLNIGIWLGSPVEAGFLVALYPIMTVILAYAFLREPLTRGKIVAILLGGLGTFLLTVQFNSSLSFDLGAIASDLFSFLAAVAWALYLVLVKRFFTGTGKPADYVTTNIFLMAVPPLLAMEFLVPGNRPTNITTIGVASLLWLGVLASAIAVYMVNAGIKRMQVSSAAITLLIFPIVNAVLSYMLLGDSLTTQKLLGGTLILAGIVAANVSALSR